MLISLSLIIIFNIKVIIINLNQRREIIKENETATHRTPPDEQITWKWQKLSKASVTIFQIKWILIKSLDSHTNSHSSIPLNHPPWERKVSSTKVFKSEELQRSLWLKGFNFQLWKFLNIHFWNNCRRSSTKLSVKFICFSERIRSYALFLWKYWKGNQKENHKHLGKSTHTPAQTYEYKKLLKETNKD